MQEKFINATQTQTTTQVSTKTKVLLGIMMIASVAGMFAITIATLKPQTKAPISDITPLPDLIDPSIGAGPFGHLFIFNGTGNSATTTIQGGDSQHGGVDDLNNYGNPPSNRYSTVWTVCNSRNRYCGTGNQFAQKKDNTTGLVWSKPCAGIECSSPSNSTTTVTYSWDGSYNEEENVIFNNGMTAQQLCNNLGSGWYLPNQKQLMQAYIDGSYGNLESPGINSGYWSGTTASDVGINTAWTISLSNGMLGDASKSGAGRRIKCVYYAGFGSSGIVFHMFNGTGNFASTTIAGGSYQNGGVDDYNFGQNVPSDSYSSLYGICSGGIDNYCGTGNQNATIVSATNRLIWSKPCTGMGCSSTSNTTTPSYYSWDASHPNNNGMTAQELCSNFGNGWYLPHQKELMQAYVDKLYEALNLTGTNHNYWSATTASFSPNNIWNISLTTGITSLGSQSETLNSVICVKQSGQSN